MTASVRNAVPHRAKLTHFDIRSEPFNLVLFGLSSIDLTLLKDELDTRFGKTPGFFANDPLVIDLAGIRGQLVDFSALCTLLRNYSACAIGIRNGDPDQEAAAIACGLAIVQGSATVDPTPATAADDGPDGTLSREMPVQAAASADTRVINRPIRTGQQAYASGGDLIVTTMVSAGGEVLADGHIHVYGPLRGRALAGVRGDPTARIFTQCLEAELVSIAGVYRTFEHDWAAAFKGKPAQIYLDGDKLMIAPL